MVTPGAGDGRADDGGAASADLKMRRRIGLLLLLIGAALVLGSLFARWLMVTCVANGAQGTVPVAVGSLRLGVSAFFNWSLPFWLVVTALGAFLVGQERLPPLHNQRSAILALAMAGLFLVGAAMALTFLVLIVNVAGIAHHNAPTPVRAWGLAPGCALIPAGAAAFAIGGWLRCYLPKRSASASPPRGLDGYGPLPGG